MDERPRDWWRYTSITRMPIPTRGLAVMTAILLVLLIGATIFEQTPRALPPSAGGPAPQPTANGQYVFSPQSGRVQAGVRYRFTLFTHCGLLPPAVDFDGSFWDPIGSNLKTPSQPPGYDAADHGVMTLLASGQAEYDSSHGPVARFTRHGGPVVAGRCI